MYKINGSHDGSLQARSQNSSVRHLASGYALIEIKEFGVGDTKFSFRETLTLLANLHIA